MVEEISAIDLAAQPAQISPPQPPNQADGDSELKAMNEIVTALNALTEEQRFRALEYVLRRFKFAPGRTAPPETQVLDVSVPPPPRERQVIQPDTSTSGAVQDIRTLKEQKLPNSAIEMAALVGYYVSELAPEGDRKKEIGKADIERHFKAAGFKLPADAGFTLVNAKNAGYLDSAGTGQYKLNPVGYNLVVHRLGNRDDNAKSSAHGRKARTKTRPQQAKKTPRAKK